MLAVLDEDAILIFKVSFTVCSRRCVDEVYKAVSV